mmetsp:Transcript_14759/g.41789  ORF Transcript_14759/g.41789 Transcript_14759/m.41789 type:complete len:295 (-) Transcript_14759:346-1230(-)
MGRLFALLAHETEHVDRLGVERRDGRLAALHIPSVAAAGGGDPQYASAGLQLVEHAVHGGEVLAVLDRLFVRIGVDVLLGMDADEVAAHRERDGQGVGGDLVAGDEVHLLGLVRKSGLFEQGGYHLRIRLGLVVGQEDDVLPVLDLLGGLLEIVHAVDDGSLDVHHGAEELAAPFVKVESVAVLCFRVAAQSVVRHVEDELVGSHSELESVLQAFHDALECRIRLGGVVLRGLEGGLAGGDVLLAEVLQCWHQLRLVVERRLDEADGLLQGGLVLWQEARFFLRLLRTHGLGCL